MAGGVSPPTGDVPGAGCAAGGVVAGGVDEGVALPAGVGLVWAGLVCVGLAGCCALADGVSPPTGVVPAAGVPGAGVLDAEVDCAPSPAAKANASAASDPALMPFNAAVMKFTPGTARQACRFAPLFRR